MVRISSFPCDSACHIIPLLDRILLRRIEYVAATTANDGGCEPWRFTHEQQAKGNRIAMTELEPRL